MSVFRQIAAVTGMNLRSVPRRLGTSSVVVIGIAGVVGVVVSVLGMTRSLSHTLVDTGRPDRAVVLRSGADNETSSTLLVDAVSTIKNAPGIARTPQGDAAATAEMLVSVNMTRKKDGARAGLTVRGIEPTAAAVRPEIRLIEGRTFQPGLREMIVGKGAHGEFSGVDIGDRVSLRDSEWTVVGVFESGGDASESRLLTDAATLLSAYQRTASNSVTVLLAVGGLVRRIQDLAHDESHAVRVGRTRDATTTRGSRLRLRRSSRWSRTSLGESWDSALCSPRSTPCTRP